MIVQILKIAVHCKKGKEPQGKTNGVCVRVVYYCFNQLHPLRECARTFNPRREIKVVFKKILSMSLSG